MSNEFPPSVTISLDEYNRLKSAFDAITKGEYLSWGREGCFALTKDEVVLSMNRALSENQELINKIKDTKLPLFSFNKTVRDIL